MGMAADAEVGGRMVRGLTETLRMPDSESGALLAEKNTVSLAICLASSVRQDSVTWPFNSSIIMVVAPNRW